MCESSLGQTSVNLIHTLTFWFSPLYEWWWTQSNCSRIIPVHRPVKSLEEGGCRVGREGGEPEGHSFVFPLIYQCTSHSLKPADGVSKGMITPKPDVKGSAVIWEDTSVMQWGLSWPPWWPCCDKAVMSVHQDPPLGLDRASGSGDGGQRSVRWPFHCSTPIGAQAALQCSDPAFMWVCQHFSTRTSDKNIQEKHF